MVKIDVALKGALAERLPGGRGTVELPDGATVDILREALGLSTLHCIYVLNGVAVDRSASIVDGDRVQIFPPVAGGGYRTPSAGRTRASPGRRD